MARPRQPIELIEAKGRAHFTKTQIEERRKSELKVNLTDIQVPDYLPDKLKDEFIDVSSKLLKLNIMTELDEDTLARYLLAKQQYLQYTSLLSKATRQGNMGEVEQISRLQDKAFKQCRAGAIDLGLTISSRCRLVVPKNDEEPKINKFAIYASGING